MSSFFDKIGTILHDLGHALGEARIELTDGRYAGDNPWFPY